MYQYQTFSHHSPKVVSVSSQGLSISSTSSIEWIGVRELLTLLSSATLSAAGEAEGEGGSMTVEEGVCLGGDGFDGVVPAGLVQEFSYSGMEGLSNALFFLESIVPDPFEVLAPLVSMLLPPAPTAAPFRSPLSSAFTALTGSLFVSRDPIRDGTGEAEGLGAGLDTITAGATSCSDFHSDTGTGTGETVRGGRGSVAILSREAV
jgi:hypothetical protein